MKKLGFQYKKITTKNRYYTKYKGLTLNIKGANKYSHTSLSSALYRNDVISDLREIILRESLSFRELKRIISCRPAINQLKDIIYYHNKHRIEAEIEIPRINYLKAKYTYKRIEKRLLDLGLDITIPKKIAVAIKIVSSLSQTFICNFLIETTNLSIGKLTKILKKGYYPYKDQLFKYEIPTKNLQMLL